MDIETRLTNLEKLVNGLIKNTNTHNGYVDADINSCRQEIGEVNRSVYPEWNPDGYVYYQGEKIVYKGNYYRCIQGHTSQADWTPESAVSLWSEISDPSEEWPEWKQPQGAHDAYKKGDKADLKLNAISSVKLN